MKLHLPHTLRTAVLACYSVGCAVVFTLATGSASAADTPVWDLSTSVTTGDYLYDAATGIFTDNTEVNGTVLNDKNGSNQIQANICFTLNLTQAKALTEETAILNMDMGGDIGLTITDTGLSTTWNGNSAGRGTVTWEALEASTGYNSFLNSAGDTCITLTFVQTYGSGVQVWDNTTAIINEGGLRGSGNTGLDGIYVNNSYILAVQFSPGWKGETIINTNSAFAEASKEKFEATAPPPPVYTDFYWESGSSDWAGDKWATTDDDSTLVSLPTGGTVNVIFNDSETATVTVGDGVGVSSMRVDAGTYTFAGNADSRIEIDGALTVANGATADIQTGLAADSIGVAGTLSLTGDIDVPAVTVEGNGVLNLSNTTIGSAMAITNNGTLNISDSTIEVALANSNTVNLSGTVNLQGITGTTGEETISTTANGYATVTTTYTVVAGGTSSGTGVTDWQLDGQAVSGTTDFSDGVLSVTTSGTVYFVTVDEVTYDGGTAFDGATGMALNGGTLRMDTDSIAEDFITVTANGGEIDLNGHDFAQGKLGAREGDVTIKGNAASVYDLGAETALGDRISLSSTDWKGTVQMGDVDTPTAALDITALGTEGSGIRLGAVNVESLTSGSRAAVSAASLALVSDSAVGGDLSVDGALTLGNETSAAGLTVAGTLSAPLGVAFGNAGSSLTVGALSGSSLNIVVEDAVFSDLSRESRNGAITLVTVTGGNVTGMTPLLNGKQVTNSADSKYVINLGWSGNDLKLSAKANADYISERIAPASRNGKAGADMLGSLFAEVDPENTAPDGAAAALLRAVDAEVVSEKELAAVAGSSVTALGMALSGDVERQLKAIRNRTTSMGVNQCVVNENMPYFNAWVNAEGNYNELDGSSTEPGYKLDSWGGTVGFDVDFTPQFTAGLALTAMYGDISTDGPDRAEGDMDTYYVSLFGRYSESAWTHTFVATIGRMDGTLERTVAYPGGSYTTEGDADGMSFGAMYEVGYVIALDEDAQTCIQPIFNISVRHASVDGYTEDGADTALEVGDQSLTTCTIGLGVRMQSVVGESLYNRSSVFEARALAKADIGDRYSEAEVGFATGGNRADVRSEEIGAFGVELGAGLTVPVGDDDGSIFIDASLELRSGYTNVNGTVGYRINF